jgi:formyltetrahydrofolate-dependent phosphoribosylglycinamide formyltransferase
MKSIAIFASGTGTNAEKIIMHFQHHPEIAIKVIVCNKPEAGVLTIARTHGIPFLIIEKEKFFRGDHYVPELRAMKIDLVVLAGFLWKIPAGFIAAFRGKIINIHPSLLPAYGGKGMYGTIVHQAVITAGEKESGITIHLVDELYDHGEVIFQARCSVEDEDTATSLANKIHQLEHQYYPQIIEELASR